MKQSLLIITNTSGGLYLFRKKLIEKLKEYFNIFVLSSNTGNIDDLIKMGCHVKCIEIDRRGKNVLHDMVTIREIINEIKRVKPTTVITYTIKPNIYGGILCRWFRIDYVSNITGLGSAFQNDSVLKLFVIKLYRIALRKAKVVYFENASNMSVFVNNNIISETQAYLLNGAGVDLEKFQLLPYPMSDSPFVFLFIGRVMKEKGIEELLWASKRLYEQGRNIKLIVLGSCEENYSLLLNQYEEEGWLKYLGFQNNVIPYIEQCHCFVLPSWHEGMANSNLECASCGRVVITSNIPGCKESVIDTVSGFLCESRNKEQLLSVMEKVLSMDSEELKQMGLNGRKHMENKFDKKLVVDLTIKKLLE